MRMASGSGAGSSSASFGSSRWRHFPSSPRSPFAADHFPPHGQAIDQLYLDANPETPAGRDRDRPALLKNKRRDPDVPRPIPVAGREVTPAPRGSEGRQGNNAGGVEPGFAPVTRTH